MDDDDDDDEHDDEHDDAPANAADLGLASSDDESQAPPPAPQQHSMSSDALRQSSLWGSVPPTQSGRGRGRGRGRGQLNIDPPTTSGGPRFERLSAFATEIELRQSCDGGASSLFSNDRYQDDVLRQRSKKRKHRRGGGEKDDDDDVSVMAASEMAGDDGVEQLGSSKKTKTPSSTAAALTAAAFGGAMPAAGSDDDSSSEDDASLFSNDAAAKKKAHKQAFPVRGVDCVGCAMTHKIGAVEKFVLDNISRMSADALWKHASLVWKIEVQDKAKKEGNDVPAWAWKELRSHFLVHCSNPVVARQSTISQLQLMRTTVENRLVRVEEDGSRELDKIGADLMLKIIKQESSERTLLANLMGSSGGAGGKAGKGSGPTVGDVGR